MAHIVKWQPSAASFAYNLAAVVFSVFSGCKAQGPEFEQVRLARNDTRNATYATEWWDSHPSTLRNGRSAKLHGVLSVAHISLRSKND